MDLWIRRGQREHGATCQTVAEEFYRAKKAIPILPRQAFERVISCPPSDKTNGAGETIKRRDLAARGVRHQVVCEKCGTRFRWRPGSRITEPCGTQSV